MPYKPMNRGCLKDDVGSLSDDILSILIFYLFFLSIMMQNKIDLEVKSVM